MKPAYGLLAEFHTPEDLIRSARSAREAGYHSIDAYSPFPIEELDEALDIHEKKVAPATFLGGLIGGVSGFFMQYYANVISYPLNIGGRPYNSWPSFIPITFELTVLGAAFGALLSMLILNRLPDLAHPIFGTSGFERASRDRFFLSIEASDPKFNSEKTYVFLKNLGATSVVEIAA